jgi:hypothetical protein
MEIETMVFHPFAKNIGQQLVETDIETLITSGVAEGYVVEYEEDFPSNTKIADSIASFANTYGGWYIVGVTTDANNVASGTPGFDTTTHRDAISKVREVAKSQIDPTPILYPQVVPLGDNRAVLVVYLPADQDGPFITRDGRIYRRIHDSSHPMAENDRAAVDRLYERSRERAQRFRDFCEDERSYSQAEVNQGWVSIFLAPYPGGFDMASRLGWSRESLQELLELTRTPFAIFPGTPFGIAGNVPFDVAHPTHNSVVLLHRFQNSLSMNTLAIELFRDGRAKIHIPLVYINPRALQEQLASTTAAQAIVETLDRDPDGADFVQLFDGGRLLVQVASLITLYEQWVGSQPLFERLEYACSLTGMWRHVAVLDADAWGEFISAFGLPVLSGDAKLARESGRGFLIEWASKVSDGVPPWTLVVSELFSALGVPSDVFAHSLHPVLVRASKATASDR